MQGYVARKGDRYYAVIEAMGPVAMPSTPTGQGVIKVRSSRTVMRPW